MMKNLTFVMKVKITFAFLVLFIALFSVGIQQRFSDLFVGGPVYQNIALNSELVADILPPPEYIIETYLIVLQMVSETTGQDQERLVVQLQRAKSEYYIRNKYWIEKLSDQRIRPLLLEESFKHADAFYKLVETTFLDLIKRGDYEGARKLAVGDLKALYNKHRSAIDEVVIIANENMKNYEKVVADKVYKNKVYLMGFTLTIMLVLILTVIGMSYTISRFSKRLILSQERVTAATYKLQNENKELSIRTEKQASSLEETSATLEEVTANLTNTVDNTVKAQEISTKALQLANQGLTISNDSRGAMKEISEGSKKIFEIIRMVEEIAFQTNILAINAAIEAAKAGEHGKGFAVVAIEVRDLAQRSSDAAKEIKTLIENSLENVKSGENLVGSSNEMLKQMHLAVENMSEIMNSIATGAKEEHYALEQINIAVNDLDSVTQRNANLVNEISMTNNQVVVESDHMNHLILENFGKMKASAKEVAAMTNSHHLVYGHGHGHGSIKKFDFDEKEQILKKVRGSSEMGAAGHDLVESILKNSENHQRENSMNFQSKGHASDDKF